MLGGRRLSPRGRRSHLFYITRDSHKFTPIGQPANLTRIVMQGSTSTPHEWLRLHVDPSKAKVFSSENVVFANGTVTPCPAPLAP